MVSKVNILGKEENTRESHIKGNGTHKGRKLQGMKDSKVPGKEKGMGRTQETQGKGSKGNKLEKSIQGKTQGNEKEKHNGSRSGKASKQ